MKRTNSMILFPMLLLLLALPLQTHGAAQSTLASNDEILRLHILANSDSEADQRVKLLVRDAIRPLFSAQSSYADARAFLLANGALLQSTVERVLRENGFSYGVQLSLGAETFPDRTYDGQLFPAGIYDALIVRLGSGTGHNWWCVLFPPLCIVSDTVEAVDLEEVELESSVYEWIKGWITAWQS